MLTVSLLRHAKSSWDDAALDDIDRPLCGRGRRDAPRMATYIASQGIDPDLVLCSPARRTRETLDLVLSAFGPQPPDVAIEPDLYLAEPKEMITRLRRLPATVHHALIVGHNPGLQMLALDLSGRGERAALNAISAKFPTSALVVVDIEISRWRELRPGDGLLRLFMSPKRLT